MQICGEANVSVIREAAQAGVPRCAFVSAHDYKFPGEQCSQDDVHEHTISDYMLSQIPHSRLLCRRSVTAPCVDGCKQQFVQCIWPRSIKHCESNFHHNMPACIIVSHVRNSRCSKSSAEAVSWCLHQGLCFLATFKASAMLSMLWRRRTQSKACACAPASSMAPDMCLESASP